MKSMKILILATLILFGGAWLGWRLLQAEPPAPPAEHGEGAPAADFPRGPHRGRLLADGDLQAEVTLFESGVPPELRIFFYRDGKPVDPATVDLTVELGRLGREPEVIRFKPVQDYLLGDTEIVEPHSFDVRLKARSGGRDYEWSYQQLEGRVTLSREAAERSGVATAVAGPVEMRRTLAFQGEVAMDADRVTHVVPPLSGFAGQVRVGLGDRVQRGETLAVVRSRELADLEGEAVEARHDLEVARTFLDRESRLHQRVLQMVAVLRKDSDLDRIHRELSRLPIGEAKGTVVAAFAELKHARERLDREKLLLDKQITTRRAWLEARAAYDEARARYAGSLEEAVRRGEAEVLQLEHEVEVQRNAAATADRKLAALGVAPGTSGAYGIAAPITGEIIEKDVVDGEFLGTEAPIFKIADLSRVWVLVTLPAADLAAVRVGQAATVEGAGLDGPVRGRLAWLGPVVGEGTQTATGRVELANPGGRLRPGLFATVTLETGVHRVPLAVKESALQTFRDWDVVFRKAGDTYEVQPLELGARSEGWVEVLGGLSPGDAYVAENSYVLKADLEKSGATHDH